MGGGGHGGGGSSTTTSEIATELKPLFAQTGSMLMGYQSDPRAGLGQFFESQPQVIPGPTGGQFDILGRQRGRAFTDPLLSSEDMIAREMATGLGQMRAPELESMAGTRSASGLKSPEQMALEQAGGFGSLRGTELEAADRARGLGMFRGPELEALNLAGGFSDLRAPELLGYGSIREMMAAPMGSSPMTRAAMAAAREPVVNELAMAGLGRSGALESELTGAYAPILAQEMGQRERALGTVFGLGREQRQGDIAAANLQSQIGERLRMGDVAGANQLSTLGAQQRTGDIAGGQLQAGIGQGLGSRELQASGIQAQIADRLRAGDIEGARQLQALGATQFSRESQLLGELGQSEEGARQLAQMQGEANYQDMLRRQQIGQSLSTGLLGGFPSFGTTTSRSSGGGGK